MRILVTGAAGFIGSNFTFYMLDKHPDARVVALDALTYAGDFETLRPLEDDPRFSFVKGDICDGKLVREVMTENRPDVVVNFAAESHVDRSITDPEVFLRTNVIGTQTLMDACRETGTKRFHQVSTDEVYGDLPLDRPDLMFTETTPLNPSSPYSASKAAADLLARAYYRTYGLATTISRCSNNYGPYQFPEKLIPLVISRALEDRRIPVYGNGENVRDWLYVEDHCSAIDIILEKGTPGEVYNIGGHNEKSNLSIVKTILKALGKRETLIEFVTDRAGHDLRYAIDPGNMEKKFGWAPKTSFDEGIARTVSWYLGHRAWWENILSGEYRSYFERTYQDF